MKTVTHTAAPLVLLAIAANAGLAQQSKNQGTKKPADSGITVCTEPIAAYGEHVRFSLEEHVQILLSAKRGQPEYRDWALASELLDWFSGSKRIPLAEIKRHMPRAKLLTMRFPADQNPPVDANGYAALIEAEKRYEAATSGGHSFIPDLMKKYGIGPNCTLDEDSGGATPFGGCAKYEDVPVKL